MATVIDIFLSLQRQHGFGRDVCKEKYFNIFFVEVTKIMLFDKHSALKKVEDNACEMWAIIAVLTQGCFSNI